MALNWSDIDSAGKAAPAEAKPSGGLTWASVDKKETAPATGGSTEAMREALRESAAAAEAKKRDINAWAKPLEAVGKFGQNVAALVDIPLSMAGQAVGLGYEVGVRAKAGAKGYDRREAARMGQAAGMTTAEALSNPLQKLLAAVTPKGHKAEPSLVAKGMEKLTQSFEALGTEIESASGGVVQKEDVQLALNAAMTFLGTRVTEKVVGGKPVEKVTDAAAQRHIAGVEAERAQTVEKHIAEAVKPAGKETVAETIARVQGIKNPAQRARETKQAKEAMKEALGSQKEVADFDRGWIEHELKLRQQRESLDLPAGLKPGVEAPKKTRLAEPAELRPLQRGEEAPRKVPTQQELTGKTTLDTALDKLGKNRQWDLTAEEKIALRDMQQRPRQILDAEGAAIAQRQLGRTDQKLMLNMALVGGAAVLGGYLDPENPLQGALLGGLAGAGLTYVTPKSVGESLRALRKPDGRLRITAEGNLHEEAIDQGLIRLGALANRMVDQTPELAAREKISTWLEQPGKVQLSREELATAKMAKDYFAEMADAGVKAGVLKGVRGNYVTHIVDMADKDPNFASWLFGEKGKQGSGQGMSPKSPFGKERKFATMEELEKAGYKLETKDIAEIAVRYGSSMVKAIANANLLDALKKGEGLNGAKLALPIKDAPKDFVAIDHPQMRGYAVNPDIASSVKFMLDTKTPEGAMKALEAVNSLSKRMKVSFSLFHATALAQAAIGARGFVKGTGDVVRIVAGKDQLLNDLKKQGLTPEIKLATEGGLKFSIPKADVLGDAAPDSFYKAASGLQGFLDGAVPGLGKPVGWVKSLNHAVDEFMWGRLHTGLKLNTFMSSFNKLKQNNIRAFERGEGKLLPDKELAERAASYTNDIFGGLNWRRMAENVQSEFGRDLALQAYSPSGQRAMRMMLFAPDWLLSTTRALTKSFGEGSGVKGVIDPKTMADLHRQYQVRSTAYYLLAANALNYYFSGHSVFKNNDWTKVDLGDGEYMRLSKHFTDPYELAHDPSKIFGRMGAYPQILMAEGKSLAETHKGTLQPIADQFMPFSMGGAGTVSSALGIPVYGKTYEARREASREWKRQPKKKKERPEDKFRP